MTHEAIKKNHRQKNSGSVPPNATEHAIKLVAGIIRLKQRYKPKKADIVTDYDRALLYFLYLWLTGQLSQCETETHIPDINIISASQPCQPHCLRKIRKNAPSWVEYSLPYPGPNSVSWQWQPIPSALNAFFYHSLSQESNNSKAWQMNHEEKTRFIAFLNSKWRTPDILDGYYLMRRDVFYRYFERMMHSDATLSTPAKFVCLGKQGLPHENSIAYQSSNSNKIRYELFHAHNRYLLRLRKALPSALSPELSSPNAVLGVDTTIIHPTSTVQSYLTHSGEIESFYFDISVASRDYISIPPIEIGSSRQLAVDTVRRFFQALHEHGLALERDTYTVTTLRDLHNYRALELSLLLIVLTGTRPTHSISIERQYCFMHQHVTIYDKGRFRPIWLCDHLRLALQRYDHLQMNLAASLSLPLDCDRMWFELDEDMAIQPINAKRLRQFMLTWWQTVAPNEIVVPYQLRHFFAQHALTSLSPILNANDIDRLMGHANVGETLGNDALFLAKQDKLTRFLNQLPDFLHLSPIKEN